MKTLKNIILSSLLFLVVMNVDAQIMNGKNPDTTSKHFIGVGAGLTTGYGIAYKYMPAAYGVQVNFAPYHTKDNDQFSLGLTFLYTLTKNNISSLFLYQGNHFLYNSQTVRVYDMDHTNYTTQKVTTGYFNNGLGIGMELIVANKLSFNVMTGYAFYDNFSEINMTAEIALFYKF